MRFIKVALVLLSVSTMLSLSTAGAQTPQRGATPPAPARGATPARGSASPSGALVATLGQLMKGILYPNSNVVFYAQDKDPAKVKPAPDPSLSTDPLASTYGGWEAVENSALALYEAADLLTIPGRKCTNGKPVPIQNPDWPKLVQGLRDAGLTVYKAAQSKNQDTMVEVSGTVSDACSACHEVYREKRGGPQDRCLP